MKEHYPKCEIKSKTVEWITVWFNKDSGLSRLSSMALHFDFFLFFKKHIPKN